MQRLPSLLHGQAETGRHRRPRGALRAPLRTSGQEVADPERLGRLRQVKLSALVEGRWGGSEPAGHGGVGPVRVTGPLPVGATLLEAGSQRGWVLDDTGSVPAFGAAMAWGRRHGVEEMHVLIDGAAGARARTAPAVVGGAAVSAGAAGVVGVVARRALEWTRPPQVWAVDGRQLHAGQPAAFPPVIEPAADARVWMGMLADHGVEVVVEHGVITGEVLGLEVARVVPTTSDGATSDGASPGGATDRPGPPPGPRWRLAVGVGHHDREAREELFPGEPVEEALDRVVALVRQLRTPDARRHPANTLARERWLRSTLLAQPGLIGARDLSPVEPPLPRRDLRASAVAPAIGTGDDGRMVVAVCSAGVDLDLVPTAADVRAAQRGMVVDRGATRLVLVVPVGDDYPVTRELAAALAVPAEVVALPDGWESGSG